jgi:hypothetical protein
MRQKTIDRWIEAAETRRVCERVVAEQMLAPPAPPTAPPRSRRAQLRSMVLKVICRRAAFATTARSAA